MSDTPERPRGSLLHELRTPLTQVIGFAELLAEEAAEGPPRDLVPALRRIAQAGRRLSRLLDEHFGRANEASNPVELAPLTASEDARLRAGFERRSGRLRELLQRYLSDEVTTELLNAGDTVRLHDVTLLLAEPRGEASGDDAAAELGRLHRLYEPLIVAAADAHGVVWRLGPEGLRVVFGFPEDGPDDSERAVRAALRMQHAARDAGSSLAIALSRGRVAAGPIGTARSSFAVVGRPVAAGALLLARASAGQVLAEASVIEAAGPKVVAGEPTSDGVPVLGLAGIGGLRLP